MDEYQWVKVVSEISLEMDMLMENDSAKEEVTEHLSKSGFPAFHKRLLERSKSIPEEDREKFPPDFSENLDYYLYGTPKKSP